VGLEVTGTSGYSGYSGKSGVVSWFLSDKLGLAGFSGSGRRGQETVTVSQVEAA